MKVRVKSWKEIKRDGNHGYYEYHWTLPMLSEIDVKEHNRNGANS